MNSQIGQSIEGYYNSILKEKSDAELREISINNANIIASTDIVEDDLKFNELLVEMQVCDSILDKREKDKEEIYQEELSYDLKSIQEKAILNLRAAASANGQLIAAILEEEDGKTAEEIAGWYDELSQIEDDKFLELLGDLVKEGIISKGDDGKYYLENICFGDLIQDAAIKVEINRALAKSDACIKAGNTAEGLAIRKSQVNRAYIQLAAVHALRDAGGSLSVEEMQSYLDYAKKTGDLDESIDIPRQFLRAELRSKYIKVKYINHTALLYLKLLGDKEK